jgi:SAM-dependent methyltransferase
MLAELKYRVRRTVSPRMWELFRDRRSGARLLRYRVFGRPRCSGESAKANARRVREGFFEKYCVGRGLDIGYGGDLLCGNCVGWDLEHGDAQLLDALRDESFDFVYSSHTLEHLADAELALRNWYRVVMRGGYLILFVPDRDLYEKRCTLPSRWNPDHRRFFLLERDDPPDTVGLLPLLARAIPEGAIMSARRCDDGHTISDPMLHSNGEYSLEVILRKARS